MSQHLFQRVLGDAFEGLPPLVRAVHSRTGQHRYRGAVEVHRGNHPLARLFAWATRLPPAGKGAIEVRIDAGPHREFWTRHVGGHAMPSRLWWHDKLLCEQLGLVRFGFALTVEGDVLVWRVVRVRAVGLPLPARWFHAVQAREFEADGRYWFGVAAVMPVAGLLVHYRGWLDVEGAAAARELAVAGDRGQSAPFEPRGPAAGG